MTVSTTTTHNEATGAGGVKTFYFTFRCDDSSWVKVYLDDVLQGSGWTASLNPSQISSPGGSITFTTAPDGYDIRIQRETARTQETAYAAYDSFPAETHELALDKTVLLVQDETRDRADGDAAVQATVVVEAGLRAGGDAVEAAARAASDAAIIASGAQPANVSLAPVIAEGATQARPVIEYLSERISVANFGAYPTTKAGYETLDTSSLFQAAFDEAAAQANATGDEWPGGVEVVIPPGKYYWDSPVTLEAEAAVPGVKSNRTSITVRGLGGANGANIIYRGTGGTALTVTNNTRFLLENFNIRNTGTGAIGINFISATTGSTSGQGKVHNVDVMEFPVGVQVGDLTDHAASEIAFDLLGTHNNDVGIKVVGINSLGLSFSHLVGVNSGPTILVDRDAGEVGINVSVRDSGCGFSSDLIGGPVFAFVTAGNYLLDNVYYEGGGPGFMVRSGPDTPIPGNDAAELLPTTLTMINCRTVAPGSTRNEFNLGGSYIVKGCMDYGYQLGGRVAYGDRGAFEASGCVTSRAIGEYTSYKVGCRAVWAVKTWNNTRGANNNQSPDDDESFLYLSDGTKRTLARFAMSESYTDVAVEIPEFPEGVTLGVPLADVAPTTITYTNGGSGTAPDTTAAKSWVLFADTGVASFTLSNPYPEAVGQRLRFRVKNDSGGNLTVSWGATYKIPTWIDLGTGKSRTYEFENTGTNVYVCTSMSADITH